MTTGAQPYRVTRRPGAVPRRAGREWSLGETQADLTPAQAAALAADPGYLVARVEAAPVGRNKRSGSAIPQPQTD